MSEPVDTAAKPLPYSNFLKIMGVVVFVFGMIELGVGANVWNLVTNDKYGSWWAAMFVVIAGAIAVFATEKLHLQVLIAVCTLSSILCFAGMLVDSLGFRNVNQVQTCVNTDTGELSGDSGLEPEARVCAQQTWRLCGCCKGNTDRSCRDFDLSIYENDNCDLVLTAYTDKLLMSAVFVTFCLVFVTVLGIFACVSYSKLPSDSNTTTTTAAPAKEDQPEAPPAAAESESIEVAVKDDTPDANI